MSNMTLSDLRESVQDHEHRITALEAVGRKTQAQKKGYCRPIAGPVRDALELALEDEALKATLAEKKATLSDWWRTAVRLDPEAFKTAKESTPPSSTFDSMRNLMMELHGFKVQWSNQSTPIS